MAEQKKFEKKEITKKSRDFSRWYNDLILKAELADYAPVKGSMVIRPYGYALWENIKNTLDQMIKDAGVQNAYFPLFIPYSFLKKEAEHVKGFSPQLAIVTHGGGKKLAQPLVVRPTSETIIYAMFSKWIKSWRDLPLLVNQWCNVVRWEMRTYLFLRTMEFLWQEGHTAHADKKGAKKEALRALAMYQKFVEESLAIPVLVGKKSESEKFPGAKATYTIEALMGDKKALQAGTSHELGQKFSQSFDIKFQDKNGKLQYVWQTCWGMSSRIVGALVMVHGDDNGLVLPPKIAPIQVVIIPIPPKKEKNAKAKGEKISQIETIVHICDICAKKVAEILKKEGVRVKVDDRTQYSPGYKFNEWELKGVPLRIEIGEKEIKGNYLTIVKRNDSSKLKTRFSTPRSSGEKTSNLVATNSKLQLKVQSLLEKIQEELYHKAEKFLRENTHEANNWQEFKEIMKKRRGFIKAFWCEKRECEEKIKEETKASTRLLSFDVKKENGRCIYCRRPASHRWYFAQAY